MKGKMKEQIRKHKRNYFIGLICFVILILIVGIKSSYAYYHDALPSFKMLSSLVGDFDIGDGDINIILYKETEKGNKVFTKTYGVPSMEYEFDDSLTTCTIPCSNGNTGSCHYTYNADARKFSLTSDEKVTCKFYFTKKADSDINVYIMKEDADGVDGTYEGKKYKMVESIPAYGYKYVGYKCDVDDPNDETDVVVEFDSNTKKFKVSSKFKNKCYAYFTHEGNADIVADVYVENKNGEYVLVKSIPENNIYVKSTVKTSACYDESNKLTNATIDYTDGYINIDNITVKQTCNIYLDLQK